MKLIERGASSTTRRITLTLSLMLCLTAGAELGAQEAGDEAGPSGAPPRGAPPAEPAGPAAPEPPAPDPAGPPAPEDSPVKARRATLPGTTIVAQGRYVVEDSSVATRTSTPLSKLPVAVRVLPSAVWRDQGARDLADATENLSGVHRENVGGFLGASDSTFLRGFRTNYVYYDGFLVEAIPSVNLGTLQSIELLKGPSSVLYGLMEPGGVLNLRTKRPLAERLARVEFRTDSFGDNRAIFDLAGPLDGDRSLLFRANGGVQSTRTFRDKFEDRRFWIAPSATWRITENTDLTVSLQATRQERIIDEGVAFTAGGQSVADIDTFLGEPGFPGQSYEQFLPQVQVRHAITENVELRAGVLMNLWTNDMKGVRRSAPTQPDGTVNRLFEDSDFRQTSLQGYGQLAWKARIGPTEHELVAGFDLRHRSNELDLKRGAAPPISIVYPVYGIATPTLTRDFDLEQDQGWIGARVQDHISILDDRLHLLLGGRFDWVKTSNFNQLATPRNEKTRDHAFTGRAGALYQIVEPLSLFGSVSQSFLPNGTGARDVNGDFLDPETAMQYEAGVKTRWLDGRLTLDLTAFHLLKDDVAISDPANPGFSTNAGKLRSRGFEVDAAGELWPGLQLIGAYTYIDTEVIKSSSLPEGERFRNIPKNSGHLWVKYTIQQGRLKDLGIGVGMTAVEQRSGDNADSFALPGYATFNMVLDYRLKPDFGPELRLRVIARNLLDEEYYVSSLASSRVFPGQPRSLTFVLGMDF